MSELIDTTEMYLKTVYEMEEDGVLPLRARIVERLDHSGPTVSQTVARMERDGLIHVAEDRSLQLTEEGRARATEVIRKHRLAERLLLDVIGMDRRLIHEEACRWEHVMSDRVEDRLAELLHEPVVDPYGNPVPGSGLEVAGESVELAVRNPAERAMRIVRIGEPIQADEGLLTSFAELDLTPGARVALSVHGDLVRISALDEAGAVIGYLTIPVALSPHLFVRGD